MAVVKNILPLKILMTADTVGGVWTYTIELCKALSNDQVQFHLVTMGAKMQPWQQKEVAALSNVTVYETEFRLEWMEDPWDDIDASGTYLRALERAVQPDVVHLNGYAQGALDWDSPVIMVAHSDVFSWWRAVKGENPTPEWAMYFDRVKAGLREATHIVSPSAAMLAEISSIYSVSNNCSVIYNARSGEPFEATFKEPTVMCIGRIWDEAKNVQLLVQAAPGIRYPVKIAGDNQFEQNMVAVNATNVAYLGKLNSEQIALELATASIYCLPARYEPFGLSVLEAALSGCALVLGDILSLREIWGDNAIYVNTSHAGELALVINKLMQDPQRLDSMADKAYRHAQQYSTEKMALHYLTLYSQLMHCNEKLEQKKSG